MMSFQSHVGRLHQLFKLVLLFQAMNIYILLLSFLVLKLFYHSFYCFALLNLIQPQNVFQLMRVHLMSTLIS